MKIEFTKMHGLGNDFVVIDALDRPFEPSAGLARFLADRHLGVGCDQLLVICPPTVPGADFRFRIWNPDGGEAEICGNGARCIVRYLRDTGRTAARAMTLETTAGLLELDETEVGLIRAGFGVPHLEPAAIPFLHADRAPWYDLELDRGRERVGVVSLGNPHLVLRVDDVDAVEIEVRGPILEHHPLFPRRTNVGFLQVLDRTRVRLRVHERGTGETLACGTGAAAAVVVGRLQKLLDPDVTVTMAHGDLQVAWAGEEQPVFVTGPTATIFSGTVSVPPGILMESKQAAASGPA